MQVSLVNNSDIFAGDGRRDQNYARAHTHESLQRPNRSGKVSWKGGDTGQGRAWYRLYSTEAAGSQYKIDVW